MPSRRLLAALVPIAAALLLVAACAPAQTDTDRAQPRPSLQRVAVDPATRPEDLSRPGHIFPLRAQPGGVLVRTGQTEGAVDLSRLAGLKHAGVICEVRNEDGTMARIPDLAAFASGHEMNLHVT